MPGRLRRIEALLGRPLDDLTEVDLRTLVAGAVREDADLDFKSTLYGATDGAKRDLASDVAAMANTVGGAIVLGVQEDDATAVDLTPLALSDGEELRMRQIVAGLTAPHVAFSVRRVPTEGDDQQGWYVLEVPRSSWAPHAVRVNDALRYPRRDGASTRYLSESEVADAYRNRFTTAGAQLARLTEVGTDGLNGFAPERDEAWLSLTVVPDSPGELTLTHALVNDNRTFLRDVRVPMLSDSALRSHTASAAAGHRRIVLMLGEHEGRPRRGLVHLHCDGSAFIAAPVGFSKRDPSSGKPLGPVLIADERLTQEVMYALAAAARHVAACGALGDAAVEVTLRNTKPMLLVYPRGSHGTYNEHALSRAPTGRHTVDLDDAIASPSALLMVTRMLVTDLAQAFGLPESPQITADGALRVRYWQDIERVRKVATDWGLDVTEETLG